MIEPTIESAEQVLDYERVSSAEERFERYRKLAGVVLAPVAFFVMFYFSGNALSPEGRRLASILAAVGVLWVTETIPLPVTAILGAVLCILLGVADVRTVLAPFANPIVFLFIGSFILAQAMMLHGLDRRIALGFLSIRWIGAHPARMLGGLGLVTALLSMWVSNTATTAMMLPIGLGILGALHEVRLSNGLARGPMDARNWPFATGMMLMIAYGASIGGIGTPVGSPPNLIGIGMIQTTIGVEISFFQWMAVAVPMLVVMGAVLFVLLYLLHPAQRETIQAAFKSADARIGGVTAASDISSYIRQERARLGPWTAGQVNTAIAFVLAVTLWILPGVFSMALDKQHAVAQFFAKRVPEESVALIAAILLFVLPIDLRAGRFTMTWPEAAKIDWGTILLFGGGMSLGLLMFQTGVAEALGHAITGQLGATSLWGLTFVSIVIAVLLSETASNTASATMIIPVIIALAQSAGVSPLPPALGACLGASYGFMLPVSTPPNAIVYGSGLVPIPKMIRAGILFDVLGIGIIWLGLRLLCPALGLT